MVISTHTKRVLASSSSSYTLPVTKTFFGGKNMGKKKVIDYVIFGVLCLGIVLVTISLSAKIPSLTSEHRR